MVCEYGKTLIKVRERDSYSNLQCRILCAILDFRFLQHMVCLFVMPCVVTT
jgi:hypothetical protein